MPCGAGGLTKREQSIGVSVNDQQRDRNGEGGGEAERTHEAADNSAHEADRQKHRQQRKCVAMTARPISRVPSMAASTAAMSFSSMKRKMFSSTIMASSITMPTIRVSASMVIWFSVKPIAAIRANVEMMDVGMAMRGDQRGAPVGQEHEDHDGGEEAALNQVVLDVIDGRFDEDRLVADHLRLDIRGSRRRFPAGAL